jgi:hypothetical protein
MEEEVNTEKKGATITISRDALGLFFTILAAGFIVAYRLLINFGVFSQALSIVMCLATFSLAILGIVFIALRDKKFTPALWLAILVMAIATLTV